METQSWLDDGLDCGYIDTSEHHELNRLYQQIGGKLVAMTGRADDFCKNAPGHSYVREDGTEYGVECADF